VSAETPLVVHSFRVGPWTVTLSIARPQPGVVSHSLCEWAPDLPDRALTADEVRQYREGRDAAWREVAAKLGVTMQVFHV